MSPPIDSAPSATNHELIVWRLDRQDKAVDALAAKMESLSSKLDTAIVHFRSGACPSPGSCVQLTAEVTRLMKAVESQEKSIATHEKEVTQLRQDFEVSQAAARANVKWAAALASVGASAIGAVIQFLAR